MAGKRWDKMQVYSEGFFREQLADSSRSARQIVPLIMELLNPRSIIDVGCGVGAWLSIFQEHGVSDILGVDGEYVRLEWLQIDQKYFVPHDLSLPLRIGREFDLVLCLEVAEHLSNEGASAFVQSLTLLSPIVLFSAAVPQQGGVSHVNEQWPDYWAALFKDFGYEMVDCLRHRIWRNDQVQWWYAQNAFLFVRSDILSNMPTLQAERELCKIIPMRLVHPKMYLGLAHLTDPVHMTLREASSRFLVTLRSALLRRLRPAAGSIAPNHPSV